MLPTIEELYDKIGGMGRFQVMTSLLIGVCQAPIGWSMLQMSFAGVIPDFYCIIPTSTASDGHFDSSTPAMFQHTSTVRQPYSKSNDSFEMCSINGTKCESYFYDTSARNVITDWELVCGDKWVKKVIISIQMAGVLVGTAGAGQFSDMLGRKKVLYTFVAAHVLLNVITGFSVSWIMFSCMRFLLGVCIGAVIVVVGPFQMEFLPIKWRPLLGILPTFSLGLSVFAAAAVILEDWANLHYACALFSFFTLFGAFFVPESPRWLSVQGRLDEASRVIKKIAYTNKHSFPENTLDVLRSVRALNREANTKARKYTYIDLFKRKQNAKISMVFFYYWFILAVVYYGISFGIGSFSGNLYLNIFLLGAMEIPVQTSTFCLNNKIGRRMTSLIFFLLCLCFLIGCLVFSQTSSGKTEDIAINVLSLAAKMMIGSAWSSVQVWGTELFPTATRNLGCGFSALGARVGGILAPFIIDLDDMMILSYAICCGLLVFGCVLAFIIPETKGMVLKDTLGGNNNAGNDKDASNGGSGVEYVKSQSSMLELDLEGDGEVNNSRTDSSTQEDGKNNEDPMI